jgi:exodeoxyribonuclease VII large subunit
MAGESQEHPLTVSSLTQALKEMIEGRFSRIYVEAEISGWKEYPSGHAYFTLKDSGAQVSCVMFKGQLDRCKAKGALKDGAKVLAYANATVYAPRGNYQLSVLAVKLIGEGDLMQKYLELKAKLESEGLFDSARKRRLPFLPRRIGIVTSEAGAVIHDMCTVLTRRFPNLEVRLYPCLVQGDAAPDTIKAGISYFNGLTDWTADLLLVARGGGSFEDLFCFNDEGVVRAVAGSKIPTVSAVGHETDYTLCDFAADVRAGTPSIAAEIAVPVLDELKFQVSDFNSGLVNALKGKYEWYAQRIDHLADALVPALQSKAQGFEKKIGVLSVSLDSSVKLRMSEDSASFSDLKTKLSLLSPYAVLDRGYSLTTDADGRVVKSADDVKTGDVLRTRLSKGEIKSAVC